MTYSADDIQVLTAISAIRKRPGMYIGNVDESGLQHLVLEAVGNVVDQHLGRTVTELHVDVTPDSWVTVRDDGPGIPPTLLESVFTTLHAAATADGHLLARPHVHLTADMRGIGVVVLNALSTRIEVETTIDGTRWTQAFERGVPVTALESSPGSSSDGTEIKFHPDPEIFSSIAIDVIKLGDRLQQLAWLNPLLRIFFQGQRLMARGGLRGWVQTLVPEARALYSTTQTSSDIFVDVAVGWSDSADTKIRSFVNMQETVGGTHVEGLWLALADIANTFGATRDVREALAPGLVAVIHVGMWGPTFAGPTREQLQSPTAGEAVRRLVAEDLPAQLRFARAKTTREFLEHRLGSARSFVQQ